MLPAGPAAAGYGPPQQQAGEKNPNTARATVGARVANREPRRARWLIAPGAYARAAEFRPALGVT